MIYSSQEGASFKAQNIAVHGRVYTVRMSKAMAVKISYLFIWFSVYLRYNVIGVIYMYTLLPTSNWSLLKLNFSDQELIKLK